MKAIFTSRNNNMAEKVKGYLSDAENKTYLVVLERHMAGETELLLN